MKTIDNIKRERYYDKEEKAREIDNIIRQIEEADREIHFIDTLLVHPYGYATPFKKILNNLRDWRSCTASSRSLLIVEMDGCIDIINIKIKRYYEPDVKIRIIEGKNTGQIREVKSSEADLLVECGFGVIV